MKVGITGGTGFLGSHLGKALAARGDRVVVFTRSPKNFQEAWGTAAGWQPMEEPIPAEGIRDLDAVVHLLGKAAFGLWTESFKKEIYETRVVSTRNLVTGLRAVSRPPRILVSASASGYYGDAGDRELTESSEPGDGFMAKLCRDWEAAASEAAGAADRVVLLRTGLVLGPGGLLGKMLPIFRLGLGGRLGDGKAWWPWIHLEDWVRLTLHALDGGTTGPLNLAAPHPVPNREFTEVLARVLGRPAFLHVPEIVLRLAGGEAAREMALVSQRMLPEKAEAEGFTFRFPDLEPALRNLLT